MEDLAMLVRAYDRGADLAEQEGDQGRVDLYYRIANDHFTAMVKHYKERGLSPTAAVGTAAKVCYGRRK